MDSEDDSTVRTSQNMFQSSFQEDCESNHPPLSSCPQIEITDSTSYHTYESDSAESIYEELDLLGPQSNQINNDETSKVFPSAPLFPPLTISTALEEHIYMDPMDCIGPGSIERCKYPPQTFIDIRSTGTANSSFRSAPVKEASNTEASLIHSAAGEFSDLIITVSNVIYCVTATMIILFLDLSSSNVTGSVEKF